PDSDFTANINIAGVTDFDSCNYDISFDASVLRLDNIASGLVGSTAIPVDVYNEISSGTYRVIQNVPGITGVSGSGYLAVLHFHVIGSGGDSSAISLANGVLASNQAEEITASWIGDSVRMVMVESEDAAAPVAVNPSPGASVFDGTTSLSAGPVNWLALWGVIGGVVVVGLVVFLLAKRRTY
ncbi:MAG: hypothetical protein J7L78_02570, partial [Dehalococcoidales bacterium]|nr:hypothetical protein [Dehalococcoidales bacterium]